MIVIAFYFVAGILMMLGLLFVALMWFAMWMISIVIGTVLAFYDIARGREPRHQRPPPAPQARYSSRR